MSEDLDTRRRKAAWRANHRGTKELDLLIGGYANAHLATMSEDGLARFEVFLASEEPELQSWLLAPEPARAVAHADIINAIRAHHGLDGKSAHTA